MMVAKSKPLNSSLAELRQEHYERGADETAPDRSIAAEEQHQEDIDENPEPEALGVDGTEIHGIQRTGDGGEQRARDKHVGTQTCFFDAERGRRDRIAAQSLQCPARPRMHERQCEPEQNDGDGPDESTEFEIRSKLEPRELRTRDAAEPRISSGERIGDNEDGMDRQAERQRPEDEV
jgi:hypothetical protein